VQCAASTGGIGSSDLDYDFGFIPIFFVGDFVWSDNNGNGVQDGGEPGIGGITVTLTGAGNPRSQVTNASGIYLFASRVGNQSENLLPSSPASPIQYTLTIRQGEVAGYRITPTDIGGNDLADSDFGGVSLGTVQGRYVNTFAIPLAPPGPGQNDQSHDAGLIPDMRIGDYVWIDGNGNGVQDAAAPNEQPSTVNGIGGVVVELFASGNNATSIASTTTDTSGLYYFSSLNVTQLVTSTVYFVRIGLAQPSLSGFVATATGAGTAATDSNGVFDVASNAVWTRVTSPALYSTSDLTIDFGFVTPLEIGDFVWIDTDANGVQNGEAGLAGVTLTIAEGAGAPFDNRVTDASGAYKFTSGLKPNTQYTIAISMVQSAMAGKYQATLPNQGTNRTVDSNGVQISTLFIQANVTTGALGSKDVTVDFGLVPQFYAGDFVWVDANLDGRQTAGEMGISGVTVELLSGATRVATTTTAPGGIYLFNSLQHALQIQTLYTVSLPFRNAPRNNALRNYAPTLRDAGANAFDASDSDGQLVGVGNAQNVTAPLQTANWGQNVTTTDFGFVPELAIGDYVWIDCNFNGVQDAGDTCPGGQGLAGISVWLVNDNDPTTKLAPAAVTASDGRYFYTTTNLIFPNQVYRLYIEASEFPQYKPTGLIARERIFFEIFFLYLFSFSLSSQLPTLPMLLMPPTRTPCRMRSARATRSSSRRAPRCAPTTRLTLASSTICTSAICSSGTRTTTACATPASA
jgi:hypothetical protein